MLVRQLPAYSPVSLRGIFAGVRGVFSGNAEEQIRGRLLGFYRAREVLLVDSGTSALRLALEAVAAKRAGPVALPAFGCYDLATAARGADVEVVLYDLDPATLGPDWDGLRRVAQGAAAVVVAHLYGMPVDMARARDIAGSSGAVLIEDAAQGVGAAYRGRPLGAHGSLGVLSFGRGKGMTGGGGGAVLANDDFGERVASDLRDRVRPGGAGFRALGALAAQWVFGRPWLYALPGAVPGLRLGETVYHSPRAPAHIPRSACSVLDAEWRSIERENASRRETAHALVQAAKSAPEWDVVREPVDGVAGYLRVPLVARSAKTRQRASAARHLGVMRGYPRPLSMLDGLRMRGRGSDDEFPGAERLVQDVFTFPAHRFVGPATFRALMALIAMRD